VASRTTARRTTSLPGTALAAAAAEINAVSRFARVLLLSRELASILAVLLAAVALAAFADYFLRLPQALRVVGWLGAVAVLVWIVWRRVWPAWRFRLSPTQVALRVERSPKADERGLVGSLASGLELLARPAPGAEEQAFASAGAKAAGDRWKPGLAWAIVKPRDAALSISAFLVVALAILAAWGTAPRLSAIGATRIVAPWAAADWPKRYLVTDATDSGVHPLGVALPLRAAILTTDRPEGKTRVTAHYRVIDGEGPGTTQRVQLTGQGVTIATPGGEGELYERLIETRSLGAMAGADSFAIEYWFETEDDRTSPSEVTLIAPPRVARARARVTPPAYAESTAHSRLGFVAGEFDMGRGADERALVGPILIGSEVRAEFTLSRPVPIPDAASGAQLLSLLAPDAQFEGEPEIDFSPEPGVWTVAWETRGAARLPIVPIDEHGIASTDAGAEPAVFVFDAVTDAEPTVRIADPPEDESVLATALVPVRGEARDDVALAWVSIERQVARGVQGSAGAPNEAEGERVEIARTVVASDAESPGRAEALGEVDLRELELSPGDQVWLWALAADTLVNANLGREPEESNVRRLRVIGEAELASQLQGALSSIREAAKRLDDAQAHAAEALSTDGPTEQAAQSQSELPGRLEREGEIAEELLARMERNRFRDGALEDTLTQARDLLEDAERAAGRAASNIEEASAAPEDSPERQQAVDEAREQQEQTRDELARLVDLLDRGEDNWLARRAVERLVSEQQELMRQAEELGAETLGRRPEDLTPRQQAELDRLAQRQQDLAERTERAIDDLARRADELQEQDPLQSSAMRDAANRGRRERAAEEMERAAEQLSQNQTGEGRQSQQQATEALENMLEDLEGAQQNRDETLRRILASLVESIEALITRQESELAALTNAEETGEFAGLDRGMIRLHQNTLGILNQSDLRLGELASVAELIESAARAQQRAIVALREAPVDAITTRDAEDESLRKLIEARDEAQRLMEDAGRRDAARRLRELRDAYTDALEEQVEIRDETRPMIDNVNTRRDRQIVRRLGARQEALGGTLTELEEQTQDIAESPVFSFAHRRLDKLMASASESLKASDADARVVRDQATAIRVLQSLVEVLRPQRNDADRFADSSGGGGEGGGQQGQQPLIPSGAELLLLKMMQQEVAERTRSLDEAGEVDDDELLDISDLQHDLAEQAEEMMRRAQEQMAPPRPPQQGGPE